MYKRRSPAALMLGTAAALAGMLAIAVAPWIDLEQEFGLPWLFRARGLAGGPLLHN